MKGLILAAGRGSRLGTLTKNKPKCLTMLGGKTLLEWQLDALRTGGVSEIAVVCGYMAEQLVQEGEKHHFTPLKNDYWASTNMVSSLLCAVDWVQDEPCIVSYSDIVYPAEHVQKLMPCEKPLCVAYDLLWRELWNLRFDNPLDDAETFKEENGFLLEIGGKTNRIEDIQGQYMGLFKLNPKGRQDVVDYCRKLPPADTEKLDMTSLLQRLLQKCIPIGAVAVEGRWCEVDNEKDLEVYTMNMKNKNWPHNWRTYYDYRP